MKDLIRKILKESEETDEFDWARGMDVSIASKQSRAPWKKIDSNNGSDFIEIYNALTDAGFANLDVLDSIADILDSEVTNIYDRGFDNGRDNCDCDCDGCCDEMVYQETYVDDVSDARDQGYESGQNDMRSEMEDKIEELNDKISELESEIERLQEEQE
jgi:hypothetical protein